MTKKVFVSGCFDLLHSGHIEFFRRASLYGDLYVSIGSDKTLRGLKNKKPVYTENERVFMIRAIKYVKDAFVARGTGMLDFEKEFLKIKPDVFVVNKEGDQKAKRELCKSTDTRYVVLERKPHKGLPIRSTTDLRKYLDR
ncbi:adenylyltransferase/cytidyltransferase family protein [Patescibacteria group bacterium]